MGQKNNCKMKVIYVCSGIPMECKHYLKGHGVFGCIHFNAPETCNSERAQREYKEEYLYATKYSLALPEDKSDAGM